MSRPNHGPRLRPNKAGVYYITWSENRRSKRLSTGTGNLPEAQKVLAGFLLELERDTTGRMTLRQMFDYYIANHVEIKVRTGGKTRRILNMMASVIGGDRFVDELATEDFTKYRTARKKQGNGKGDVINDSTLRREITLFKAAANFAVRNRKIDNRQIPVVLLPDENEGRDRWLTQEEAERLLAAAQDGAERLTPTYRLVAIALATGKRRGSIESLKWFQVDLKNRVIDFRRPGEPETKKRRGRAPISTWLLPVLECAYREKVNEYVLGDPLPALRRLMPRNQRDRKLSDGPGSMWKGLNRACQKAKVFDASCHTLRHTWGTWAAQRGLSMWAIAGVLGCSVQTATRNYLHHSPDHLRQAADQVTAEVVDMVGLDALKAAHNDEHKGSV